MQHCSTKAGVCSAGQMHRRRFTTLGIALTHVHAASALSTGGQIHHQQLTGLWCALPVGCNTADSQHWSVHRLSYMLLVPRRSDATPKLTSWGVLCRSDATPQIHSTGLCSDSRSCCQCLEFFIKPQA